MEDRRERELRVAKKEVETLKPGRTCYEKRGLILFKSDRKTVAENLDRKIEARGSSAAEDLER